MNVVTNTAVAPPQERTFTVLELMPTATLRLKTDTTPRPTIFSSIHWPVFIVLGTLIYFASVLWYVIAPNGGVPTSFGVACMWTVCVPYIALMIHKLLMTIRAIEAPEQDLTRLEQGECEEQFGDHAYHDAIAVIGDVCIYVIVILVLCGWFLAWQLWS